MTRTWYLAFALLFFVGWQTLPLSGQPGTSTKAEPDLADFRTLDKAITVFIARSGPGKERGTGYLGIHVKHSGKALTVAEIQSGSPAGQAGVRTGDVLLKIDGIAPNTPDAVRECIQSKQPGDKLTLSVRRGEQMQDIVVTLAATSRPLSGSGQPPVTKGGNPISERVPIWSKDVYRLAVIVIDFADVKHNDKIATKDWDEALFSKGSYDNKMNPTGQAVHGSLNDYFHEQSQGKLRLEGKVFAPVEVTKKRADYVQGSGTSNKTAVLTDALDKLTARAGKDPLKDFDGVCFIYAGARVQSNAGSVYYPHRGSLTLQGKRLPYLLCPEGGQRMESIGIFALELAKTLGLPDMAARTDAPGSEGLGVWCLMSSGAAQGTRPTHLCAWCKEQLGWLTPATVDPTTKQQLIIGPVTSSSKECLKALVRLDGSEYFLIENRTKKGFDAELPAQGLLIWRVVHGRPMLEESHGVVGPTGPRVHLNLIPYPSKANTSFTPTTTPSSRSPAGGGLPVHITNIRRLPDGRITLFIGYEYH